MPEACARVDRLIDLEGTALDFGGRGGRCVVLAVLLQLCVRRDGSLVSRDRSVILVIIVIV